MNWMVIVGAVALLVWMLWEAARAVYDHGYKMGFAAATDRTLNAPPFSYKDGTSCQIGVAIEDVRTGMRVEVDPRTGFLRRSRFGQPDPQPGEFAIEVARYRLDAAFGEGKEAAIRLIRTEPVTSAIYEVAVRELAREIRYVPRPN